MQEIRRAGQGPSLASSKRVLSKRQIDPRCNLSITPTCLQEIYNIPSTPATQANNTFFVSAFNDEFADPTDTQVRAFVCSFSILLYMLTISS